ncbi:RAI1 like PD-(D/E)XK nuclease domain-containing protein [Ditylenchus destructor]|nr:RAI1 like PD-(D/E)XK nuclease domain-containing protein [Ditylenchus destructor]
MSFKPLSALPRNYSTDKKECPDIKQVDEFSVGDDRTHLPNKRACARYLINGYAHDQVLRSPVDLRDGCASWVQHEPSMTLSQIKQWIIGEAKNGKSFPDIVDAHLVTSRGILVNIATSPYLVEEDGIKLACQKYKDVIFIHDFDTEKKESGHSVDIGTYDPSEPVNDNVQFCAVFNANIAGVKVLYRSPINCLTSDGNEYLEAKTHTFRLGHGRYFPKKALRWWMQCNLTKADKIVIGIRDKIGIFSKVHYMGTKNILQHCSEFNVNVCFAFLETFLEAVKDNMQSLTEDEVLVVERKPKSYEFNFNVLDESSPSLKEHIVIDEDFRKHFEQ